MGVLCVAKGPAFLQVENKDSRSDQTVRAFKRDFFNIYEKNGLFLSYSSD